MSDIFNPPDWPRPQGYSNVVSASGRMVFVAGQVGWNTEERFDRDDLVGQIRQALLNIRTCLQATNAAPEHLVRMTWYVVDKQEYLTARREIGAVYREVIGRVWPAMSLVEVSGLIEEGARVEIEATAVVPE